jgi:hypothetical protein
MTCGMCDAYPARIRLLLVPFLGETRKGTRRQAKPASTRRQARTEQIQIKETYRLSK